MEVWKNHFQNENIGFKMFINLSNYLTETENENIAMTHVGAESKAVYFYNS